MAISLNYIKETLLEPYSQNVSSELYTALDSPDKIREYVEQRFESIFLVELLDRIIELVPNSILTPALIKNKLEEEGKIEAYGAEDHDASRNLLASAIGVNLVPKAPQDILEVISSKDMQFLIGILFYIEYQVPEEYESLLKRIREFFPDIKDLELYHLLNHITHDEFHYKDILIRLHNITDLDLSQVVEGIEYMHSRRMRLINLVKASTEPTQQ